MTRRGAMSRREVLCGRFLGAMIGSVAERVSAVMERATADADDRDRPPGHAPEIPVMRYPQTDEDVRISSLAPSTVGSGEPAVARRRASIPILRPPGAIDERGFLERCTRCNDCAVACPYDAIVPAPSRFREAAGTPMIDPDLAPCRMCEDTPCIAACDDDVLSSLVPVQMGVARITEQTCLAYQGSFCSVCVEQCPVEGAIVVSDGKPRVAEDRCTGCGVCRYVCPAPENSILLMPTFSRPSPSREQTDA